MLITKEMMGVIARVAETYGVHVHRDYSGRYMYGETCLGLSFDGSVGYLFSAFLRVLEWESDYVRAEAAEMFEDMRTDELGLGIIFYFPGWKPEENDSGTTPKSDD